MEEMPKSLEPHEETGIRDKTKDRPYFPQFGLGSHEFPYISLGEVEAFQERRRKILADGEKNLRAWSCAHTLPIDPSNPVIKAMTKSIEKEETVSDI